MPDRRRRHLTRTEERLLRVLGQEAMTAHQLAEQMGISAEGVKSHLAPLRFSGYVEQYRSGAVVLWRAIGR